jgi:hypothetical protein
MVTVETLTGRVEFRSSFVGISVGDRGGCTTSIRRRDSFGGTEGCSTGRAGGVYVSFQGN